MLNPLNDVAIVPQVGPWLGCAVALASTFIFGRSKSKPLPPRPVIDRPKLAQPTMSIDQLREVVISGLTRYFDYVSEHRDDLIKLFVTQQCTRIRLSSFPAFEKAGNIWVLVCPSGLNDPDDPKIVLEHPIKKYSGQYLCWSRDTVVMRRSELANRWQRVVCRTNIDPLLLATAEIEPTDLHPTWELEEAKEEAAYELQLHSELEAASAPAVELEAADNPKRDDRRQAEAVSAS